MEPQIFVIDDEDSVRDSLDALLDAVGHETQSFATAAEFLEALADTDPQRPRCLLLDLQLPDMNGLELLRELNNRNESMPTIVMTGHDDEFESIEMHRNAVACFQKPFDTSQLLKVLAGVFAHAT
jgi:two-component system, LuxR family, response regulator FixJ